MSGLAEIGASTAPLVESQRGNESSGTSGSRITSLVGGVLLGMHGMLESRAPRHLESSASSHAEYNEAQEQVRELYAELVSELGSLSVSDLQPGQRREALSRLAELSSRYPDAFPGAFERVFYTTSRKMSDWVKASALRYSSEFARPRDRANYTRFLISRLGAASPSEASAAATALAEFADSYSAPALSAARSQVRWKSVLSDLNETIDEIKSE